ncbi:MAG: ribonuclease P protein component [Oscillospiraceae bacterium]|nr:ribonuclease P protein component [Oscillospiraceae bacterium]
MHFSSSLKENYLFRRIYHRGRSEANSYLVLYCLRNGRDANRVGVTVSGKLGHAVERNLIRRRLREIYRLNEERFLSGWDIIVVARTRAMSAPYAKLEEAYLSLAAKLKLLREV